MVDPHPLHHAVIRCIYALSNNQTRLSHLKSRHVSTQHDQGNNESCPSSLPSQYLCTGYDLYTTREPCVM
jgi:tRNA-specific adenosine deaminase 3